MIKIFLHPKKEVAVLRRHPWVFSGAIRSKESNPVDGELVEVCDSKGESLAIGHWQDGSIAVRILAFRQVDINSDFWHLKLLQAYHLRQDLHLTTNPLTNCYRLIHGEGDGLPGLVIDIYKDAAILQCHSIGMHLHRHEITAALLKIYGDRLVAVYDKSKETLPARYADAIQNTHLHGSGGSGEVLENGLRFTVNWEEGQKTGFFLDQRENRALLGTYAHGKTVLNTFAYSGGFSMYALKAGAALVHSVDVSKKAMALTDEHVTLNHFDSGSHVSIAEDVKHFFKSGTRVYDLMVVDPPAFAKNVSKRHNAVQGYKQLNVEAIKRLAPGGILFTFSCSQVVDRSLFYNTIVAAAIEAGREARVLHHLSQPADHPVSLFHPEGAYLKGLVINVT